MANYRKLGLLGASAGALFMACAPVAYGQATDETTAGTGGGRIADVFVTARKRARSEALQVTPVSASAITGAQLQESLAADLNDVGRLTAGASFQQANSKQFNNFSIRGMGTAGTSPQDEPTVGVIYDGVYVATGMGTNLDLFDVSSVEVLRGPQGTLLGRNVTGGAVILTTNNPTFDKTATASLGYGNYAATEASLVLNSPLLGDVVAGRLALKFQSNDGWAHNYYKGSSAGGNREGTVRGSLLLKPNEDLDITLKAEWNGVDGDPQPVRGVVYPGTQAYADGWRTPSDFWTIGVNGVNRQLYQILDLYSGVAQVDWNVANGVLTWTSGYRTVRNRTQQDFDGTPTQSFFTYGVYNQEQTSTEVRFAQDLGRLNYTVGASYLDANFQNGQERVIDRYQQRIDAGIAAAASSRTFTQSSQDQNSFAVFAEADFKITDQLTATAGVRYTEEEKVANSQPFKACVDFSCLAPTPNRTYSADNTSPKFGLSYKISDNHLLFGSVTRGFRSGGYALRGAALVSPYDAEEVTAYEIASKNDFFDDRVRLNLAVYQNEFSDLQRTVALPDPVFGIVQSTFNAADATIKGVEVEFSANVTEELSVNLTYAYTDAQYETFLGITPAVGSPATRAEDLEFIRTPESVAGASLSYKRDVAGLGTIGARLGASYSEGYFFDDINTPVSIQPAYTLVDGSIALTSENKDWTVTLWGKNLTNEEFAQSGASLASRGQNFYIGQPLTYGVKLQREF